MYYKLVKISSITNYQTVIDNALTLPKLAGGLGLNAQEKTFFTNAINVSGFRDCKLFLREDETAELYFSKYVFATCKKFMHIKEAFNFEQSEAFRPFDTYGKENGSNSQNIHSNGNARENYNAIQTDSGKTTGESDTETETNSSGTTERLYRLGDEWERLHNVKGYGVAELFAVELLAGVLQPCDDLYDLDGVTV